MRKKSPLEKLNEVIDGSDFVADQIETIVEMASGGVAKSSAVNGKIATIQKLLSLRASLKAQNK